jgi:arabinofuranosyltransferase
LENPASHLLAVLFLVIFLERNALGDNKIHLAYFIAGLATFNRMDNILLFLPATIYLMTQYPNKSWRFLLLGFLPFILWEIFSLFYFGFLFPNTAYAKLNTGISLSLYLKQGVLYFINSLRWDPVTLLVIGASLLLVSMRGKKEEKLIALGMGLYLLYVLYIGGDFMSGRFFSTVYLLGTILLTSLFSNSRTLEQVVILLLILAFGYAGTSPVFWDWRIDNKQMRALPGGDVAGIGDQRELWYEDSTLMNMDRVSVFPSHIATEEGLRRRSQGGVFVEVQIGYLGFFAGPKTYIIDEYSLTDPLLARLPIDDKSSWRIGHFSRLLPDGYLSSIESGTNMISDPNLAEYYDKLKLIISGEILNRERLETIWRMNTGQYDYLIANYLNDK